MTHGSPTTDSHVTSTSNTEILLNHSYSKHTTKVLTTSEGFYLTLRYLSLYKEVFGTNEYDSARFPDMYLGSFLVVSLLIF